jgi:hypothetical protein
MRKLVILMTSLLLSVSAFADANLETAKNNYLASGKKVLEQINSKTVDMKTAGPLIEDLIKNAQVVIKIYSTKYPESKKLLDFLIANTDKMKASTFDVLQKDWHDAAALTKDKVGLDLKSEANEKYLDPCHILVHPIMTLVALKNNKLDDAKEELTEGMEQISGTASQLSGK